MPVYVYATIYAGMAIGSSKSQTNSFFPGNRHIAVSQAVDTPISRVPLPTPQVSNSELPRYSNKTVSFRCCQFWLGGSNTEKAIVKIGKLSIKAVPTILNSHKRLVIFIIAYSKRLKARPSLAFQNRLCFRVKKYRIVSTVES